MKKGSGAGDEPHQGHRWSGLGRRKMTTVGKKIGTRDPGTLPPVQPLQDRVSKSSLLLSTQAYVSKFM